MRQTESRGTTGWLDQRSARTGAAHCRKTISTPFPKTTYRASTAVLGATKGRLIGDLRTFGLLVESLSMKDAIVYAEAMDAQMFLCRDKDRLEVDAIIQADDGS